MNVRLNLDYQINYQKLKSIELTSGKKLNNSDIHASGDTSTSKVLHFFLGFSAYKREKKSLNNVKKNNQSCFDSEQAISGSEDVYHLQST